MSCHYFIGQGHGTHDCVCTSKLVQLSNFPLTQPSNIPTCTFQCGNPGRILTKTNQYSNNYSSAEKHILGFWKVYIFIILRLYSRIYYIFLFALILMNVFQSLQIYIYRSYVILNFCQCVFCFFVAIVYRIPSTVLI